MPAPSRQDFSAIWTILIPPFFSPLRAALEMNQWTLPRCETSRFPLLTFPHSHFTQTPPCPEHPPHCSVSSPGCQALCKPSPKNNPCLKEHLALKDPQGITSFLHFLAAFTWSFCLWSTAFLFASWNPPFPLSWIPLSLIFFSLDATNFSCLVHSPFNPTSAFFGIAIPAPWRSGRKGVK